MANTADQAEGATRLTSLLPQRRSNGLGSTRTEIHPKQRLPIAEHIDSTTVTRSDSPRNVQATHGKTTSMLPPSSVGRSQSTREPPGTSSLRRPSMSKPHSQGPLKTPARARTSFAKQEPQTSVRSSFHGRSISHQVERSTIPQASTSRSTLGRQSPMSDQSLMCPPMQHSFTLKKPVVPRPFSPISQPIPKDDISSAECFQIQMELAQLHLLHRSAQSIQYQWEQSAMEIFRLRFAALAERNAELKDIAQEQQALVNQLALVQWSNGKSGIHMGEKVALLSRNVTEMCSLLEPEGKYTRILEVFESWFSQVLQIREQRKQVSRQATALALVEGIGDGWKAEAMVLERELTYCSRDLKAFGNIRTDSSLGRIRALYSKLVLHLIEEIDVIQWIENEITVQETSWVENTIQELASVVDKDLGSMVIMPTRN